MTIENKFFVAPNHVIDDYYRRWKNSTKKNVWKIIGMLKNENYVNCYSIKKCIMKKESFAWKSAPPHRKYSVSGFSHAVARLEKTTIN